jgi:hypothetical protein
MNKIIDALTYWASEPSDITDFVLRHTQILAKVSRSLNERDEELKKEMKSIHKMCEERKE